MRFFLAVCILVFYSIGLGVSLLPAIVGIAGFWASCGVFVGIWLFVLTSCLFYLEATMANQDGANVASISRKLIGKTGAIIGSTAFIYAHNTVLAVYFFFGMHLFNTITKMTLGYGIPHVLLHILLAFFLGGFLFLGLRWCGLLAALCLFLFIGTLFYLLINAGDSLIIPSFDVDWFYLLFAIPIIYYTAYVQTIMPSLATFMERDWVKLKKVVFWGTFCGLLVNLLWLCISISAIPEKVINLAFQNYNHIYGSTDFLSHIPAIGNTIYVLLLLTFCASFPLSAIVLLDFYSDLFKIAPENRTGWKRLGICLLTIVPPFLFFHIPKIDSGILINYTLGLSILLISTVFPLLWMISAHYKNNLHRLRIGGWGLLIYGIAAFFLIYIEGVQLIKL